MNIPDKIVHLIAEDDLPALQSWVEGEGSLGARDNNGETLLHKAAYRGAAKTAGWLISRGLDVNVRDNSGYAPLHEAARANRIEVMPLLLGHGADTYARTSGKKTPLDMAEEKGGYEGIRLLRDVARRPRWIRTGEDEVAHVAHKDGVRYKVTQIFNFATRSYLVIA